MSNFSPRFDTKMERKWDFKSWCPFVTIIGFAVVCFCFFQFLYPYHFFFKGQNQLFLMSWSYVNTLFAKPAWMACLAGEFLTQFYEYGLPVKIGDLTYDEALDRFKAVYQYEMDSFAELMFQKRILVIESYLRWIGYDTSEGIDMTFDTGDGEEVFH